MRFLKLLVTGASRVGFGIIVVYAQHFASATEAIDPQQFFVQTKVAAGGNAWAGVGEIVERGTLHIENTNVPYHMFADLRGHRFVYIEDDPSHHGFGYDARGEWAVENGFVQPLTAAADVTLARTAAYIARNGWWNPQSDPATMTYAGLQKRNGKTYDTIHVTPKGGLPLLVWIDHSSHRIAEVQEVDHYNITITTKYGSYQQIHGIQYSLLHTVQDNGTRIYREVASVMHVAFLPFVQPSDFARPKNHLTGFIDGNTSTAVSFDEDNPESPFIIVTARLNGLRPLHLLLDTGGRNTITPAVAKALGLQAKSSVLWSVGFGPTKMGYVSHVNLTIGKAVLRDQRFWIIYNPALVHWTGKYAIDGSLGYELLRNFVVTIDYQHHTLVLTKRSSFNPKYAGAPVHLWFTSINRWLAASASPVVSVKVGKRHGLFLVDTGNEGYAAASDAFLRSAGLDPQLQKSRIALTNTYVTRTGRVLRSYGELLRIPSIGIPPFVLQQPVVGSGQSGQTCKCMFASLNGDLGTAVWSRFTITFDYAHATMYLRPNARFNIPSFGTTSGLAYDFLPSLEVQVGDVIPHSPGAQAGIRAGDIVLAIKGVSWTPVGLGDICNAEITKPTMTLTLRRGSAIFTRTIELKEMLP